MLKGFSIAIDGPVAAGKGTIAPVLAKKLNGFYLYTGAMYRCVALYCLRNTINLDDQLEVESSLSHINIDFTQNKIILNNEDVTEEIKREEVAAGSAKISVFEHVRKELVAKQREIADKALNQGIAVVAEGRDVATKVLPSADLKIFLTATSHIRAQRRLKQIEARGQEADFNQVLEDVEIRDKTDREREIDPLVENPQAFGYTILDNSNMSENATVNFILQKIKELNDSN